MMNVNLSEGVNENHLSKQIPITVSPSRTQMIEYEDKPEEEVVRINASSEC